MKVRYGFVSNSSSSSFIIALNKKPETVEEMKKLLFKDEETYEDIYHSLYKNEVKDFPAIEIAQMVFDDLSKQKVLSKFDVFVEMSDGYLDGGPNHNDFSDDDLYTNIDWDAFMEANDKYAKKKANQFYKKMRGKKLYVLNYCDNDGRRESAMEHGDLFKNVKHFKISKH